MSSNNSANLSSALTLVGSDKVRDRAEGLLLIKRIFNTPRNCEALTNAGRDAKDGDSNGWLKVYQTLFGCAGVERAASLKATKSTAGASASSAATARLGAVASDIRWLIETSITYLNKRTIASIFAHLIQSIVHRGTLLESIATDYAKALKVIFSYKPHLDWLEERNWRVLMSLCWDVALGRRDLSFDRDDWDEDAAGQGDGSGGDEVNDQAGAEDEDVDELEQTPNRNGKRPTASLFTKKSGSNSTQARQRSRTSDSISSLEQSTFTTASIEMISLIPILLGSQSAPLLAPPRFEVAEGEHIPSRAGIPLLKRTLAFLEKHNEEVTPTKYIVAGLNVLLQEIELNYVDQVSLVGTKIFPHLVNLWPAKDPPLRDSLILSMRILLPFLCRSTSFSQTSYHTRPSLTLPEIQLEPDIVDSLTELIDRMLKHTVNGARRLFELPTKSLWYVFESERPGVGLHEANPFRTRVMRGGSGFETAGALAWVAFELRADVIAKIHTHAMVKGSHKRRKLEDPVETLYTNACLKASPNRLINLQTLFFLVERHWNLLYQQLQFEICSAMAELLTDPSPDVQEWALLVLNSVIQQSSPSSSGGITPPKAKATDTPSKVKVITQMSQAASSTFIAKTEPSPDGQAMDSLFWINVWTISVRKISLIAGPVARSAAHIAHALWLSGVINRTKALKSIEAFLRDIAIQGPAKASDAICSFVNAALGVVAEDVTLMRAGLEDSVCTWLSGSGLDIAARKSGMSHLPSFCYSPQEILQLTTRLGGMPSPDLAMGGQFVLEDDVIVQRVYAEMRDQDLRTFLLEARLPSTSSTSFKRNNHSSSNVTSTQPITDRQRQRGQLLSRALMQRTRQAIKDWEENVTVPTPSLARTFAMTTAIGSATPEVLLFRTAIDQAVLGVMFEVSCLREDDMHVREGIAAACQLLSLVLTKAFRNHLAPLARAQMIIGIDVLFGCYPVQSSAGGLPPIIAHPKRIRGIVGAGPNDRVAMDASSFEWDKYLTSLWETPEIRETWALLLEPLRDVFRLDADKTGITLVAKLAEDDDDRDFHIKEGGGPDATKSDIASDFDWAIHTCSRICVRALLKPKHYQVAAARPIREKTLLNLLIQADGLLFLSLAPAIFEAISARVLEFKGDALELVFETVNEFLGSYEYASSTQMRCLAIRFISVSQYLWKDDQNIDVGLTETVLGPLSRFSILLDAGRIASWSVRDELLRTLGEYVLAEPDSKTWTGCASTELLPIHLIQTCLEDPDSRVRARAAIFMAETFGRPEIMKAIADPWGVYTLTAGYFFNSTHIPAEQVQTRLLFFANVTILSDVCRRASLYHMYDMVPNWPSNCPFVLACLHRVAETLGLSSIRPLYLEYAPRLTASQEEDGQDPSTLPMALYGCRNKQEWSASALPLIDCVMLQMHSSGRWQDLHPNDGADCMRRAWPMVLAMSLAFAVRSFDPTDGMVGMDTHLESTYKDSSKRYKGMAKLYPSGSASFTEAANPYFVVSGLFSLIDNSEDATAMANTLRDMPNGFHLAEMFSTLVEPGQGETATVLFEVNMPRATFSHVLEAHRWVVARFTADLDLAKLAHHVMVELLCKIDSSILVNERQRYVRCLIVVVTLYETQICTEPVLTALLRHVTLLFGSVDTAREIAPLLLWMLRRTTIMEGGAKSKVATTLAAIAASASRYGAARDSSSSGYFQKIVMTVEGIMAESLKEYKKHDLAVKTLLLWPRTLPHDLDVEIRKVDREVPLSLLRNPFSGPARLALSKEMLRRCETDKALMSEQMIWYFRATATDDMANWDNVQAFLKLLLNGFAAVDIPDDITLGYLHDDARIIESRDRPLLMDTSLRTILYKVYDTYSDGPFQGMRAAYGVLSLMAHVPEVTALANKIGKEIKHDLATIQRRPIPPTMSPSTDYEALLSNGIWIQKATDYTVWIVDLSLLLANGASRTYPICACLGQLLSTDTSAANAMLAPLVHLILAAELAPGDVKGIPKGTGSILSEYFNEVLSSPETAINSKRAIIDVVLYLRRAKHVIPGCNHLDQNIWLEIDYTLLSQAAVACKAYPTAILFYEISVDPDSRGSEYSTKLDAREVDDLLYRIYTQTSEPDGFYGIPRSKDPHKSLMRRLKHEADWESAFIHHGADFEAGSLHEASGITNALQAFGYNRLAVSFTTQGTADATSRVEAGAADDLSYNLAWRTGNWDLPLVPAADATHLPTMPLYRVLRTVHRGHDDEELKAITKSAIFAELARLGEGEEEDVLGLRETSLRLLRLREVQNWTDDFLPLVRSSRFEDESWRHFLHVDDKLSSHHATEIMAVRISLLKSALAIEGPSLGTIKTAQTAALEDMQSQCHLALSRLARADGNPQGAINAMAHVNAIKGAVLDLRSAEVIEENAHVLWIQGEHTYAINMLQEATSGEVTAGGRGISSYEWQSKARSVLGDWMAEARQADPDTIERDYFDKSIALCSLGKSHMASKDQATIYFRLAKYSDQQQRQLYADNEERMTKISADQPRLNAEIQSLAHGKLGEDLKEREARANHLNGLIADRTRDHEELSDYRARRLGAVVSALVNYAKSLAISDEHDSAIMQLCALWMEQHANEGANLKLKPFMERVPTHKFIFLAHQLTSRLTLQAPDGQKTQNTFQKSLDRLVFTIATDHPFHIVYQILTMAYPGKLFDGNSLNRRTSGRLENPTDREEAAIAVHLKLRSHPSRGQVIKEMETFVAAAVHWSCVKVPDEKVKGVLPVPSDAGICKLNNMSIPIASMDVPIDFMKAYRNIVRIVSYDSKYAIAGGAHRPKIMLCLGSDGIKHRQLFKADDDLRQDSVMEQFFALVNRMLLRDTKTRDRELRFRTYNVVPLAQQTGIIEFVGNTTSLGEWLTPAHITYRPDDMQPKDVKDAMKKVQEVEYAARSASGAKAGQQSQLPKLLAGLQQKFHPVMRHFFTEKRKDPIAWYTMRLRYARSLAVGSIAGYAVGLGDRHCSNILLDQSSGELVHIDLGIAFDQGRRLTIPELVPFRLTNDLVDALGSSGVEGVYKRCCEETLRVLRDNSQTVLTVLEVFKYDPLHTWTKPDKLVRTSGGAARKTLAATMQNASEYSKADRILGQVAKKLDKHMSIEYTVTDLIRTARDINNLAVIFTGWQCWY